MSPATQDPIATVTTNLNRRIEITRRFITMKRVSGEGSDAEISAKLTYDEHLRLAQGHLKAALEMEIQAGKEGQTVERKTGWKWRLEELEEDENPEADGWVVDSEELGGPELFEAGDYQQACVVADNYVGTVRQVYYGKVVHDGRGLQQCEYSGYTGYGEPPPVSRCWRNEHDSDVTRHVWQDGGKLHAAHRAAESFEDAIYAAVRDKEEREGREGR